MTASARSRSAAQRAWARPRPSSCGTSPAACGIKGITLIVDSGHAIASLTNAFPPGKAIMDLITGRVKL